MRLSIAEVNFALHSAFTVFALKNSLLQIIYIGIGFGRAVPEKRVAAQFELGAMFHGKPKIVSSNSDVVEMINSELDNNGFINKMNKITLYPVLTFRLNGRIF